ncbi:bifunctional phosphoribosylaminoimidazolecarboxamide formyltransferase/inosine monophosphate cyclohydrolase [bacterium]|nr:MAG: bifunctional phosphoribosylaminoimidazolecarboxamide formyltransferase/inosine monophosphate cyclohydrolase [bacterium]
MERKKTALISVYEKKNVVNLARFLRDMGVEIISTGGTYKLLKEKGIDVINLSDYTGFPEILDGRVKTLHPKVFGGILALKENGAHMATLEEFGISKIDLVVVNLYPFERAYRMRRPEEELIELIDIGGVSLIRAAAKNYRECVVVTSPEQYDVLMEEMRERDGKVSLLTRMKFAREAFRLTSHYDRIIEGFFAGILGKKEEEKEFPGVLTLNFAKVMDLRYGENPHQRACLYREEGTGFSPILSAYQHHGKQLSFNNILDADAAFSLVLEFEEPCACIVKHHGPCGVGRADNILDAFRKAYLADPTSAFGGIIALNRTLTLEVANEITSSFFEVVIAPAYEEEALNTLKKKKNLRILEVPLDEYKKEHFYDMRKIRGGLLVQDADWEEDDPSMWEVVSDREPTRREWEALKFAWKVVKWVKSNAIVLAIQDRTLGIGGGQPSRVDAVELAIKKAHSQGHYTGGTALASDGFFPFRDSIDLAAEAGVTAVIEPGGSIRDREVIDAANEHDIALVFTKKRHFRH